MFISDIILEINYYRLRFVFIKDKGGKGIIRVLLNFNDIIFIILKDEC